MYNQQEFALADTCPLFPFELLLPFNASPTAFFFSFRSLWTVLRQSTIDSNGLDIVHWPLFHSSFFLFSCCCCCCFLLPLFVVRCITLIPTPSLPLPRTHTLRMCVQPPSLLSTYNTSPPPLPPLYTHQSLSRNFIMFSFHSPLGLVKRYTPLQYPLFLFSMLPSHSSFLHTHTHTLSLSLSPPSVFLPAGSLGGDHAISVEREQREHALVWLGRLFISRGGMEGEYKKEKMRRFLFIVSNYRLVPIPVDTARRRARVDNQNRELEAEMKGNPSSPTFVVDTAAVIVVVVVCIGSRGSFYIRCRNGRIKCEVALEASL
ncbi:hypothetical protein BKA57DRAFT_110972 [Linnemannia elongata]|nr:hypothetical protein BKA57DRAFT_110972 [Linnemannia elongata]